MGVSVRFACPALASLRFQVRKKHQSDLLDQLDYQTALKEEEEHMTKLELDEVKV